MLNLAAFGPFTERNLVFDKEACGLHIIYGPNEAGKSSALRGLKGLLYGIEERTPDNFLHPNDKLRLTGHLRTADKHELVFARRKGRKNTLLTEDGEALDEQVLAPFLQGVTTGLFETLFGIDHQALVQGGQEILEQKGDVGKALFSAALGSHTLHSVLAQLDDEADGLFRPRGSTQTINSALKTYTELKKEIRVCSLSSREWDEHRRVLERTGGKLSLVDSELASARIEINRLKRIKRVAPKLARRRQLMHELDLLGDVIIVADDFTERRQHAVKELDTAQAVAGKAMSRLEGLQKQLDGLTVNQGLLGQAENIENLHARLGAHRTAMRDHPNLVVERKRLLTDAESLLKEVRPDLELQAIESLRPVAAKRKSITALGDEHAELVLRVEQAETSRREADARLNHARREHDELPEPDSPEALRSAIAAARKSGDLDKAIQTANSELTNLQRMCDTEHARLSLWEGNLEELSKLEVPGRESISHFEQTYDDLESFCRRLREKKIETADDLQDISRRLDEIQRAGTIPTEAELLEARSNRDQLWQLLRRRWIDGEETPSKANRIGATGTLADTFEDRLADADELSDRLRREADRVHTMANLQAGKASMQQQKLDIARAFKARSAEKTEVDARWRALWAPCRILPRTPREMRSWLGDFEKLRGRVEQLNQLRQTSGELKQTRKTHIRLLDRQMDALGKGQSNSETLEPVLLECERLTRQLDEARRKCESLDMTIKGLESSLESLTGSYRTAMKNLDAWKAKWRYLMENLGLKMGATPSEVAGIIDMVRELFTKYTEAEKLQTRIAAIDSDANGFRAEVESTVARIAPNLADLSADDAVIQLNSLLSENRSRQTQHQQIDEQYKEAQREIRDSGSTIQTMTNRLDFLCKEAGCGNPANLEEGERMSARFVKIKAEIESTEQQIFELGEGATIAELEKETADVDPVELPVRITELGNKINDELEPNRTDLAVSKGRVEKELELMDGSDKAAALAEQAQATLASIRSNSEQYVRARLAGCILRDEIERYRKKNQGPLIKRASELFATLTLGSFDTLLTDFNEKDEPVLAGIRPDGVRVYVEGMSTGSRDQLYLALRLASLEKYMESSEPMPFIVDDILVDFDDERSAAALKVLADLSGKTQVILFTHHRQLVEQTRKLGGNATVYEL